MFFESEPARRAGERKAEDFLRQAGLHPACLILAFEIFPL